MDYTGFYFYNGTVQTHTVQCAGLFFDDFNSAEPYKTFAFSNQEFNEEVGFTVPKAVPR